MSLHPWYSLKKVKMTLRRVGAVHDGDTTDVAQDLSPEQEVSK